VTRSAYPGYDVLDGWDTPSFDAPTRAVLDRRLNDVPPRRFFTEAEWPVLDALCARIMPQPERSAPVPIAPWIDAACHADQSSGTRRDGMPADAEAWRQGLAALEAEAQAAHGRGFTDLADEAQDALLKRVDAGDVSAAEWQGLPPQDFFRQIVLRQIVRIYYVHPAAQSEIGFGGPASPRGYVRLSADRADPWEAPPGKWEEP